MLFYRLHQLESLDDLLVEDVSRARQRMRQPGRKMNSRREAWHAEGICLDLRWVIFSRIRVLRLSLIACHRMSFYRSCRKAKVRCQSESPLLSKSASLPIVPQRASCFVRPCSRQRAPCFFGRSNRNHGNVINSKLVREFPNIRSVFGASTISCSSTTCVRHDSLRKRLRVRFRTW